MKRFHYSIRRALTGLSVALVVALTFMILVLLYTGNRIIDQYVSDVGHTALTSFRSSLDADLEQIASYCRTSLSGTSLTQAYAGANDAQTAFDLREAIREDMAQLTRIMRSVRYAEYRPNTRDDPIRLAGFGSLSESDAVARALAGAELLTDRWRWIDADGASYLCCVFRLSDGECVVCVDDSILTAAKGRMTDLSFTCEQDGRFVDDAAEFARPEAFRRPILLPSGDRKLLMSTSSEQGDFNVCCLVSMANTNLNRYFRLGVAVSALLIALACVAAWAVLRHVGRCFTALDSACRRFGGGELDTRIDEPTRLTEAEQIFGTFNEMAEQIQDLKISLYEHELAEEHSKMRLLRTQIKSHFFINCLNIIYSLASVGNNALIKEFSLCLVDYFRYLGSGFQDAVRLGSELEHLKNYVRIFEIRYPGRITVECQIDPDLETFSVLPMVPQTFVENVFQHGLEPGKSIHLEIRVIHDTLHGDEGVRMDIYDNGPGFSQEALAKMHREPDSTEPASEHGNGIRNAEQRMMLFYSGRAELICENIEDGAHVSLFFPNID